MLLRKTLTLAATLLIILLLSILSGCRSRTTQTTLPEERVVEVVEIVKMDVFQTITLSSQIIARLEVRVLAELPGRVSEVNVKLGDEVTKGDTIVVLDSSDYSIQLKQSQAALSAAKAQLAEAQAGARPQDRAQAQAALNQAESSYSAAKNNLERMEILYSEGMIALRELEMAQTQYASAKAGYQSAKATFEKIQEGATANTLQMLRAQVSQAEAGYSLVRRQIEKMNIKAPIDGKIAAVLVREGELTGAGNPAVIVVDDNPVVIDLFVDEGFISYLEVGQRVTIEVPSASAMGIFDGYIVQKSPAALQGGRTFQVKVEAPNDEGLLKQGMFARVTLETKLWEDSIMVPTTAVQQRDGREYIFLYDSGVARMIEVKSGKKQSGLVQVFGDIDGSLPVIIRAPRRLNNGESVSVAEGER
jgi:multidrug resistance efflux pump